MRFTSRGFRRPRLESTGASGTPSNTDSRSAARYGGAVMTNSARRRCTTRTACRKDKPKMLTPMAQVISEPAVTPNPFNLQSVGTQPVTASYLIAEAIAPQAIYDALPTIDPSGNLMSW